MERFLGLDLHKNYVVAAGVSQQGTQLFADRFNLSDGLARFAKQLQPTDTVVVEASTNVWPVHDLLSTKAGKVLVANPIKTRAIAEARIKTDKIDALTLPSWPRPALSPRFGSQTPIPGICGRWPPTANLFPAWPLASRIRFMPCSKGPAS